MKQSEIDREIMRRKRLKVMKREKQANAFLAACVAFALAVGSYMFVSTNRRFKDYDPRTKEEISEYFNNPFVDDNVVVLEENESLPPLTVNENNGTPEEEVVVNEHRLEVLEMDYEILRQKLEELVKSGSKDESLIEEIVNQMKKIKLEIDLIKSGQPLSGGRTSR